VGVSAKLREPNLWTDSIYDHRHIGVPMILQWMGPDSQGRIQKFSNGAEPGALGVEAPPQCGPGAKPR